MMDTEEAPAVETGDYTDGAVFAIDLNTEEAYSALKVTLDDLSINTFAGLPENATVTNVTYSLYHQYDGRFIPVAVDVSASNGIVTGLSFEADSFSNWIFLFKVFYSKPIQLIIEDGTTSDTTEEGTKEILLSQILQALSLEDDGYPITVKDVRNVVVPEGSDLNCEQKSNGQEVLIGSDHVVIDGEYDFYITGSQPISLDSLAGLTLQLYYNRADG